MRFHPRKANLQLNSVICFLPFKKKGNYVYHKMYYINSNYMICNNNDYNDHVTYIKLISVPDSVLNTECLVFNHLLLYTLSQNSVANWRYSVSRRHKKMTCHKGFK